MRSVTKIVIRYIINIDFEIHRAHITHRHRPKHKWETLL